MDVNTPCETLNISVPKRLRLTVTKGPCKGQTYDTYALKCCYMTVGRIKKAKIYIKDSSISENHAEIAWDGKSGSWTLRDTCSSNGTAVNDAVLPPYHAHQLKTGEYVAFGNTVVTVELEEQSLSNLTIEMLMRAYFETRCQALEGAATEVAKEMVRNCHDALDGMLLPPGACL